VETINHTPRDSHGIDPRSIAKAVSCRILGTLTTALVVFIAIGRQQRGPEYTI